MLFIDLENFEIARGNLYRDDDPTCPFPPFLEWTQLGPYIVNKIGDNYELTKTFLFLPRPDNFLMKETWRAKRYHFFSHLSDTDFFKVIEGRHVARNTGRDPIDLSDKTSYYVTEKGTDVNLACQLLTKAFHNAFDCAVVLSSDTDYIPVYNVLSTLGKLVVVCGTEGSNFTPFRSCTDKQMALTFEDLQALESSDFNRNRPDVPTDDTEDMNKGWFSWLKETLGTIKSKDEG
jgi:uncharacterized LabA/DUF88 family protein